MIQRRVADRLLLGAAPGLDRPVPPDPIAELELRARNTRSITDLETSGEPGPPPGSRDVAIRHAPAVPSARENG